MFNHTIQELAQLLKLGKISATDLIEQAYANIEKLEPKLNSLITLRDKADAIQEANSITLDSPLAGIPFVMKDAYVTTNMRTTSASKVLDNFNSPYNATVYNKLIQAGGILIGKANMDAWGHGGSTENTDYQPTHNPYDLERVAGGSSGGPASAVSARLAVYAIGEDTGGSIRNPASWTNLTGLKVTYGRVSRYGAIAYASSFDTVGPMAKSALDCAYILQEIAGHDPYDATSSPQPVPNYIQQLTQPIDQIKIGVPHEMFAEGLDNEIKDSIMQALQVYQQLGATLVDISLPIQDYVIPLYYLIGPSETSSNLARYDGVRYGGGRQLFTSETMRRIMIGTYALSSGYYDAYYRQAQKVRTLLRQAYDQALKQVDVIAMPVMPTPPTKIGEIVSDPLQNLLADIYTVSQNPAGIPALAHPTGFTKTQLPIGMQLVGSMFSEALLLNLGHQYQLNTDWHLRQPSLLTTKS